MAAVDDPETYNREVIWPDKVRVNLEYIRCWSLYSDARFILWTVAGIPEGAIDRRNPGSKFR